MSGCSDYQRSKAYRWEDLHIHGNDKSLVKFKDAQGIVDYVWAQQGLTHPPRITAMPPHVTRALADATRMRIRIPERGIKTSILLHEIAHSMCPTHGHGPRWVGMFMILLEKHMKIPMLKLMYLAKEAKVHYDVAGPDLIQAVEKAMK